MGAANARQPSRLPTAPGLFRRFCRLFIPCQVIRANEDGCWRPSASLDRRSGGPGARCRSVAVVAATGVGSMPSRCAPDRPVATWAAARRPHRLAGTFGLTDYVAVDGDASDQTQRRSRPCPLPPAAAARRQLRRHTSQCHPVCLASSDDVLRILVSTDNHLVRGSRGGTAAAPAVLNRMPLRPPCPVARRAPCRLVVSLDPFPCLPALPQGVWEKDEVRKDDSFRSFEEVFEIAAGNNSDMVLLGALPAADHRWWRHRTTLPCCILQSAVPRWLRGRPSGCKAHA